MGRAVAPVQTILLIRELAWRTQARQHGGFDANTQRLLNNAIRSAPMNLRSRAAPDEDGDAERGDDLPPKRRRPGSRSVAHAKPCQLPPTSRLIRVWHGVRHEVTVLEGGRRFLYRDKTYRSLTAIALEITGTAWSGPRFFGLTVKHDPGTSLPPRGGPTGTSDVGERTRP